MKASHKVTLWGPNNFLSSCDPGNLRSQGRSRVLGVAHKQPEPRMSRRCLVQGEELGRRVKKDGGYEKPGLRAKAVKNGGPNNPKTEAAVLGSSVHPVNT